MEKKKEQLKKKAFEQDKKAKMAQVVASTAMSIASNMAAASAAARLPRFGLQQYLPDT